MAKPFTILLIGVFFYPTAACLAQKQILRIDPKAKSELYFIDVSLKDDSVIMAAEKMLDQTPIRVKFDSTDSFLLSDPAAIKNISTYWKGRPTNEMYMCWYDYFIYVVENGVVKDEIRVNEKCMQAVSYHGIFDFKDLPLKPDTLKGKILKVNIEFKSKAIGRNFINELKLLGAYHTINEGHWYDHDGSFDIQLRSKKNWKKSDFAELEEKINKAYPNGKYSLRYSGTYRGHTYVTIDCAENFYQTFNLYSKRGEWRHHAIGRISVFSKEQAKLKQLIQKYSR